MGWEWGKSWGARAAARSRPWCKAVVHHTRTRVRGAPVRRPREVKDILLEDILDHHERLGARCQPDGEQAVLPTHRAAAVRCRGRLVGAAGDGSAACAAAGGCTSAAAAAENQLVEGDHADGRVVANEVALLRPAVVAGLAARAPQHHGDVDRLLEGMRAAEELAVRRPRESAEERLGCAALEGRLDPGRLSPVALLPHHHRPVVPLARQVASDGVPAHALDHGAMALQHGDELSRCVRRDVPHAHRVVERDGREAL